MNHHEPLLRITKRNSISTGKAWLIRLAAVVLSLIVCALLIFAIVHMNPLKVYVSMFQGAFGTSTRSWATIRNAMTLLCIAIGLAPAFKMKFWNIGAEGQLLVGGIATAACMIYFKSLPTPVLFLVMIITSCVAGAVWGLLPALFKSRWNTNETLFTLMMNYVAIQLTSYFVALWENPFGSNSVGVINSASKEGWLPNLLSKGYNGDYLLNVIIVMALAILMFVYLRYTKQGYEIAVVGESENTARYSGISVSKVFIRTMLLSGAICGLSGFIAVAGASHTISVNTGGGRGFTAIIVCWLAKFNTFVMVLISFLIVFLQRGAAQIASEFGLNEFASDMVTGIILFFILGSEFFINYRLVPRGKKEASNK